jgi:hypothetical protein
MGNKLRSAEKCLMRLAVQAGKGYTPLKLNVQNVEDDVTISEEDLNTWRTKTQHGKFPNSLQENHMDKESSPLWLSTGCIYPETEGFAVTIQDRVIKREIKRGTASEWK